MLIGGVEDRPIWYVDLFDELCAHILRDIRPSRVKPAECCRSEEISMLRVADLLALYLLQNVKRFIDLANQIVQVCVWVAHIRSPFATILLRLLRPLGPAAFSPGLGVSGQGHRHEIFADTVDRKLARRTAVEVPEVLGVS